VAQIASKEDLGLQKRDLLVYQFDFSWSADDRVYRHKSGVDIAPGDLTKKETLKSFGNRIQILIGKKKPKVSTP